MRNKRMWVVSAAIVAVLGSIAGAWFAFRSREINVWVYTDYAFRFQHPDWSPLIQARFNEVNRIYQRNGTGILWKLLDSSEIDPTREVPGLDNRRATMALHFDRKTDIYVIFTGIHEGNRTGSVSPFTRVAIVVDFPDKSETLNSRALAHELAHLFGTPHDPDWLETLMADKPDSNKFSTGSLALIRRMRDYPFDQGIDGLSQGSWDKRALNALAQYDTDPKASPIVHANLVLGTTLLNERKRDAAIAHFRAAVAADSGNKVARLDLIEAYTRDGQEEKALDQARQLANMFPNDALAHRALGAMLARTQQPDAAVEEIRTAARLDPNSADTQVLLGTELAGMFGHMDDAIAALEEAVRLSPTSPRAEQDLEKAQTLKKLVGEDAVRQRGLLHDNPNDPDATYRLAKDEARMGDLKSAIHDFQKSAELLPSSASPHMELAEMYLLTGDTDTAWVEVRKARALGTEPPRSLLVRLPAQK